MSEFDFEGSFYAGVGDGEYLQLLDTARGMFSAEPTMPCLPMLYTPSWNGLIEGYKKWECWWIQNSYGTSFCALPFLDEPFVTFVYNAQDLWFKVIGDGVMVEKFKTWGPHEYEAVVPDGCLVDAAKVGWAVHRQGDGWVDIHDWGVEFTAAGVILQAEMLLISRDESALAKYLPLLERCVAFVETRRDPATQCFLAGPAGNLLAPSFAGWKKPDGTFGQAFLAGLSITQIAALERMVELETLAGRTERAAEYRKLAEQARGGLGFLTEKEGYFVKSVDPDGTRHGVFGAAKHGYFEASPNHDAIMHRVVDDVQAEKILEKMLNLPSPGLRPHTFILTNFPSLDDMYDDKGINEYGTWVNGGHWATCEARMVMAYYRMGRFEDARRSMLKVLEFAKGFHLDAPLTKCGSALWFGEDPIHITYDAFGGPSAMIRGLFEYRYHARGLTLIPHIPPTITKLEQRFPIRLGSKKIYLSTDGVGKVTGVKINGKTWMEFDGTSVRLPVDAVPEEAVIQIELGGARSGPAKAVAARTARVDVNHPAAAKAQKFRANLAQAGLSGSYVDAHAWLIEEMTGVLAERREMLASGELQKLPEATQKASDEAYEDAIRWLTEGLEAHVKSCADSGDERKRKVWTAWEAA